MSSSTSSTPWLHRLGLGKGTLAVSSTARHDGVSPELELYVANCHRGFSSPYSCLGSTIVTLGSSCRARLSQSWLAITDVSLQHITSVAFASFNVAASIVGNSFEIGAEVVGNNERKYR